MKGPFNSVVVINSSLRTSRNKQPVTPPATPITPVTPPATPVTPVTPRVKDNNFNDVVTNNQYEASIQHWNAVLATDPQNKLAHYYKGVLLHQRKDYSEAVACFSKAIDIDPEYKEARSHWKKSTYEKITLLNQQGKHSEAAECSKALQATTPREHGTPENKTLSLNAQANVLYNQQKYAGAVLLYDKTLQIDPKNQIALQKKGISLLKQNEYDEALSCFKELLALSPQDVDNLHYMGRVYYKTGNYTQAIVYFDAALKIHPDHADAAFYKKMTILMQQAYALLQIEKQSPQQTATSYDAPLKVFLQVLKQQPNNLEALAEVIFIHVQQAKDYQATLKLILAVDEAYPVNSSIKDKYLKAIEQFVTLLLSRQQFLDALTVYEAVIKTVPTTTTILNAPVKNVVADICKVAYAKGNDGLAMVAGEHPNQAILLLKEASQILCKIPKHLSANDQDFLTTLTDGINTAEKNVATQIEKYTKDLFASAAALNLSRKITAFNEIDVALYNTVMQLVTENWNKIESHKDEFAALLVRYLSVSLKTSNILDDSGALIMRRLRLRDRVVWRNDRPNSFDNNFKNIITNESARLQAIATGIPQSEAVTSPVLPWVQRLFCCADLRRVAPTTQATSRNTL